MASLTVPQSVVDWVLEPANPSIRLIGLQHLQGRSPRGQEARAARAAVAGSRWAAGLLARQHPEGWWVNPKNCYQPRGLATVWHLQVLAELGMPGDDPRVVRACDRFVNQNGMADGGFSCGVHARRYSEECLTGHMLYTLVAFGRDDAVVEGARDWLLARQLPDGGWNCRPGQSHSSFISTIGALKALAILPGDKHAAALQRSIEFVLDHGVFFSHTTGKPVKNFWPPVSQFPAHYAHDLLHALRGLVLARTPPDDRLDRALGLVAGRGDSRGRWMLDVAPWPLERAGRPSKWTTVWSLAILRHFRRLRVRPHSQARARLSSRPVAFDGGTR